MRLRQPRQSASAPEPDPVQLRKELAHILAGALVAHYQRHTAVTVHSPRGTNRSLEST